MQTAKGLKSRPHSRRKKITPEDLENRYRPLPVFPETKEELAAALANRATRWDMLHHFTHKTLELLEAEIKKGAAGKEFAGQILLIPNVLNSFLGGVVAERQQERSKRIWALITGLENPEKIILHEYNAHDLVSNGRLHSEVVALAIKMAPQDRRTLAQNQLLRQYFELWQETEKKHNRIIPPATEAGLKLLYEPVEETREIYFYQDDRKTGEEEILNHSEPGQDDQDAKLEDYREAAALIADIRQQWQKSGKSMMGANLHDRRETEAEIEAAGLVERSEAPRFYKNALKHLHQLEEMHARLNYPGPLASLRIFILKIFIDEARQHDQATKTAASEKKRAAMERLLADPAVAAAYKARGSKNFKAMHTKPENAAALKTRASAHMKRLHADPEFTKASKERCSEGLKRHWALKKGFNDVAMEETAGILHSAPTTAASGPQTTRPSAVFASQAAPRRKPTEKEIIAGVSGHLLWPHEGRESSLDPE